MTAARHCVVDESAALHAVVVEVRPTAFDGWFTSRRLVTFEASDELPAGDMVKIQMLGLDRKPFEQVAAIASASGKRLTVECAMPCFNQTVRVVSGAQEIDVPPEMLEATIVVLCERTENERERVRRIEADRLAWRARMLSGA